MYALLGDDSKVQAKLQDNTVIVNVTDEFTAKLVKSEFSELLKDAAKKVLSQDVIIQTEVVEAIISDDSKRSKLESLSAFDIVSFE